MGKWYAKKKPSSSGLSKVRLTNARASRWLMDGNSPNYGNTTSSPSPYTYMCIYIYICIYVNICILLPVFDGNNIGSRYITSPCRRTARCPGISAFCIAWMAQLQSWVNICQCQGGCDIPIHMYIYIYIDSSVILFLYVYIYIYW